MNITTGDWPEQESGLCGPLFFCVGSGACVVELMVCWKWERCEVAGLAVRNAGA